MFRSLLLLFSFTTLQAQVVIDTFAGTPPRSGLPAAQAGIGQIGEVAWDHDGNLVFVDEQRNVVWRLRPDGTAEIVAGTGEFGFSGDGGPATSARLAQPTQLKVDSAGNLYVVDAANYRIRKIDAGGIITTVVGTGVPLVPGQDLEGPGREVPIILYRGSFTVDAGGMVYFADNLSGTSARAIRRVDTNGDVQVIAGSLDCSCRDGDGGLATHAHFKYVVALAIDRAGNLYVGENDDYNGDLIRKITPGGTISQFARVPGWIQSFAMGGDGWLYVSLASSSPKAVKLNAAGEVTQLPVPFNGNLSPDATGRVVAALATQIVDANSGLDLHLVPALASSPDGTPRGDAVLPKIGFLAVNRAGEVHFLESETCRIRKFDLEGKLRTVAGSGVCGELPGLPGPSSFAFGPDGRMWIRAAGRTFIAGADGVITEQPLRRDLGVEPMIAVDTKGRLYVMGADYLNRLELDGTVKPIVKNDRSPNAPPGAFIGTQGLGTDLDGNLYFSANGLYRIDEDGTYHKLFTGSMPGGNYQHLSIDREGRAWTGFSVSDASGTARVRDQVQVSAMGPNGELYGFDGSSILRLRGAGTRPVPVISQNGIVSAASYAAGSRAANELISIFGTNFGMAGLQPAPVENNRFPYEAGGVRVFVDGRATPIVAVTPTQINAILPEISDVTPSIVVQTDDRLSAPATISVAPAAFGLFTADSSGKGQAAVLNQNGSRNSSASPAPRGSVISLFGTGQGRMSPNIQEGAVVLTRPYPATVEPPKVSVGGQSAEVLYAGSAPTLVFGVFQINVRIPQTIPPGTATMQVTVQGVTSPAVTVEVQ
ncbi:MAG: IPT/TIG domain-containing protein [Acidobacteriota bacterium]